MKVAEMIALLRMMPLAADVRVAIRLNRTPAGAIEPLRVVRIAEPDMVSYDGRRVLVQLNELDEAQA